LQKGTGSSSAGDSLQYGEAGPSTIIDDEDYDEEDEDKEDENEDDQDMDDEVSFRDSDPSEGGQTGEGRGSMWKCRLCTFQNQRPIRLRNHIVCHHLKLKPFSCPYCHLYAWKSQVFISLVSI